MNRSRLGYFPVWLGLLAVTLTAPGCSESVSRPDRSDGGSPGADAATSVDGACGAADGVEASVAPTEGLCSAGTPSAVAGSGPWAWTCSGTDGGADAACLAPVAAGPIDGECGSADGTATSVAPTEGLCSAGTPSAVSGTGPWAWTCAGVNGGTTAYCAASVQAGPINGQCGSADGVAVSAAPTSGLCTAGTPSAVAGTGPWAWTCLGANGGTDATCSAPVKSSGGDIGASLQAAGRTTEWAYTGVPGGIPHRTNVCATFSSSATASAINSAISSCQNGVVVLNAGTYSSLGGTILLNKSNVTLRGAGADKTIISGPDHIKIASGGVGSLDTAITGGATKGSTTFTVASTSSLSVGRMIEIDRTDDKALIPYFGSWSPSNGRSIVQVNVITAISGNTVTVRNPLFFDFASGSPQINFYYSSTVVKSGVEDLKIDLQGQGGYGIQINAADSCWVKGVDVGNGGNYMLQILSSVNLEVRDSFIHDGGTGPNHSGICFMADYRWGGNSSARIENNIINNAFPNVEINNDSSGLYVGYNYSPGSNGGGGNIVTWNLDDNHAPFPVMNLYEGNVADMFGSDGYFGGSGYATTLRNYLTGLNPNFGASGNAVVLKRLTYYYSVVGNVLGSSAQNPAGYATGCTKSPAIYELGFPNIGNCGTTPWDGVTVAGGYPDAKVSSTLVRWGNYDYFNKATRYEASEIPSGVSVPTNQVVPASLVYSATPAWWPSTIQWPPIGPDVTGGNGDTSGHAYKIPAQACWESRNLASGGAFNAAACY